MNGLRTARTGDEPQLRALWKLVFGDTDEFLDAFFELLYPDCRTAVVEEDGRIIAAAYAIALENIRYIYAVATHPDARGRGCGEAVTVAAAGGEPACLYPASEGLRGWYARRMGAESVAMAPRRAAQPLDEISAEAYHEARETLLRGIPHAVYTPAFLRFFSRFGRFYKTAEGVCAMDNDGNIKEALPGMETAPFHMGLNGAPAMYWGLVLD